MLLHVAALRNCKAQTCLVRELTQAARDAGGINSGLCFGKEGPAMWKVSLKRNISLTLTGWVKFEHLQQIKLYNIWMADKILFYIDYKEILISESLICEKYIILESTT